MIRTLYSRAIDQYGTNLVVVVGYAVALTDINNKDGSKDLAVTMRVDNEAGTEDDVYVYFSGKNVEWLKKRFDYVNKQVDELREFFIQSGDDPSRAALHQPMVVLGTMDEHTLVITGEKFVLWNGMITDNRLVNAEGKPFTVYAGEACRNIKSEMRQFKDGKMHNYFSVSVQIPILKNDVREKVFFTCNFFDDDAVSASGNVAPGSFVAVLGYDSNWHQTTNNNNPNFTTRYANGKKLIAC